MTTHESVSSEREYRWFDPRTWFGYDGRVADIVGGAAVDPFASGAEENKLARRALGARRAKAYAGIVRAEQEIRATALQSAREERAGYERDCETASRIMVENGLRDARRLGGLLNTKLSIYRAARQKNPRSVVDALNRIESKPEERSVEGLMETLEINKAPDVPRFPREQFDERETLVMELSQ